MRHSVEKKFAFSGTILESVNLRDSPTRDVSSPNIEGFENASELKKYDLLFDNTGLKKQNKSNTVLVKMNFQPERRVIRIVAFSVLFFSPFFGTFSFCNFP